MLQIRSTVNNTGLTISGNYDDLNALYDSFVCVIGGEDDYFYEAAARLRVLSVCCEMRHAYIGERETINSNHTIPYYSCRILWPEAVFVAAVLDNFVLLSTAKKLYVKKLPEMQEKQIRTVLPDHIALIHYFQDLVWNELERIVGAKRVKTIFGEYNDLRLMHYKYPQLDGFYTQWLDLLNIEYLCSDPEQRSSHLTTILKRIFSIDEEYLFFKNNIEVFAKQEGIRVTGIKLTDCIYPDNIEW